MHCGKLHKIYIIHPPHLMSWARPYKYNKIVIKKEIIMSNLCSMQEFSSALTQIRKKSPSLYVYSFESDNQETLFFLMLSPSHTFNYLTKRCSMVNLNSSSVSITRARVIYQFVVDFFFVFKIMTKICYEI